MLIYIFLLIALAIIDNKLRSIDKTLKNFYTLVSQKHDEGQVKPDMTK